MSDNPVYKVPASFAAKANLSPEKYDEMYSASIADPDAFWAEQGKRLDWMTPYTKVKNTSWDKENLSIKWFEDGALNVSANCIDRHATGPRADKVALLWEGDDPADCKAVTYRELLSEVSRFANVLKKLGAKKGDRITIYMPMILEAAYAMLACTRIGAVHSVVFGGFSPEALAGRITDCDSRFVITADEGLRGGRIVPLKVNADAACQIAGIVETQLVARHTGNAVGWTAGRDHWLDEVSAEVSDDCPPEPMNAEDPLFILYTSGSTGQPKGVLHTTGGYLVWASMTHEYVFDLKEDDVYWCSADIGWVTGHSYIVYGPLANGATSVMFEGVPTYPDASRFWQVCDKHKVSIFYTAPTAIRALMREGEGPVKATDRSSIRLLGTVGEPINPEAWEWYYRQTETGACMMVPLPGATDMKPGAASHPFFGVQPKLVDAEGVELHGETEGNLIIADSWPGQMRTVYGDHQRFIDTYFSTYPGTYFTGDGCKRDADGFYWITGRVDDVINVSGHRMGTAEVESALVSHDGVAEAAVVGYPHDIKGQGIYAYVTPIAGVEADENLKAELVKHVRKEIGPIASPDLIPVVDDLIENRQNRG